jgi:hypothetical protein
VRDLVALVCGGGEWGEAGRKVEMSEQDSAVSLVRSDALLALVETWKNRARQQFLCGKRTTDCPMGKRLVEHGAMVYANCALGLEEAMRANAGVDRQEKPHE